MTTLQGSQKIKKVQGLTLIELLVALSVIGILAAVAVPEFRSWTQYTRIESASNYVLSTLNFARSEAVKRNAIVNLGRTGSVAQDWSDGWRIYTDAGASPGGSAYNQASGDLLLRVFEGYGSQDITVKTNSAGNQWIAFTGNGLLFENGATVSIAVCDSRGVNYGRLIIITTTGRTVVTEGSPSAPIATCNP